jgi:hypothetical protein
MESERIYFDEAVKGHKLLVTSHVIAFKGERLDTSEVNGASAAAFRQSVNAIPTASSYRVSVTSQRATISVECSGFFWLGKSQYERLRSAIGVAVGNRLIRDALQRLMAGETLTFEHKGSLLERDSRFILSRGGINIEQKGVISRKAIAIEWRHLQMKMQNGTCILRCYSTGNKVAFQMWHMANNMVFGGVLHFLLDKANYRLLEKSVREESGATSKSTAQR